MGEPAITALNVTSCFITVSEIVYVEVSGTNFGQYSGWQGPTSIFVMIDNSVINFPVAAVNSTSFVFPMPLGLDLGIHLISVSNDAANYGP